MSESSPTRTSITPLLSDGAYNKLKHTAAIVLPAVAALYIALSNLWHWPHTEEVAGTIAAVNTALGGLLAISTAQYNNSDAKYAGVIKAHDDGDKITAQLVVNDPDPASILKLNEATFKVSDTGETPTVQPPQQ